MKSEIKSLKFDIIIIGGGIKGASIARDAALRGLKVIIIEKNDFGSGKSSNSDGLFFRGFEHLNKTRKLMKELIKERDVFLRNSPYIAYNIPFIYPIKEEENSKKELNKLETLFSIYNKDQGYYVNRKKHFSLSPDDILSIDPSINSSIIGGVTTDEYFINVQRLIILNLLDAKRYGAEIMNYTEAIKILSKDEKVYGILAHDKINCENFYIFGKTICNVTGSYSDLLTEKNGFDLKIKKRKNLSIFLERKISNYGLFFKGIDGKLLYIYPFKNKTAIFGYNKEYYGYLSNLSISNSEIEYILKSTENIIPKIREFRIIKGDVSISSLYYKSKTEFEYKIINHKKNGKNTGFYSIIGGKFTQSRLIAEKFIDIIAYSLGNHNLSLTAEKILPGAERLVKLNYISKRYQIPLFIVKKLYDRYGDLISNIIEIIDYEPSSKALICNCETVIEAEIKYLIRYEFARKLSDILRRSDFGDGTCQGSYCVKLGAKILKNELIEDFKEQNRSISEFLNKKFTTQHSTLVDTTQIQQMEINLFNNKVLPQIDGDNYEFE